MELKLDVEAIEERIVDDAVRRLVGDLGHTIERLVKAEFESAVKDAVAEHVKPVVDECFIAGFPRTNTFGEPQGEPKGLREFIVDAGMAYFEEKVDRSGRKAYDGTSRAQRMLDAAVEKHVGEVVKTAINKSLDGLADEVGKYVGEHVKKTLTGRR